MKHCKKCDRNYSEKEEFCEGCGGKLVKLVEAKETKGQERTQHHATTKRKTRRKIAIAAAIVVVIIIVLMVISALSTSYVSQHVVNTPNTGSSPSLTTTADTSPNSQATPIRNCRDVQEPYTIQVPYQDTEPYSYTFQYVTVGFSCTEDWSGTLGFFYKCTAQIRNQENEGGQFAVAFNIISSKNKRYTDSKTNYIASYSTQNFDAVFDTEMGEKINGTIQVTPPSTTRYTTVTKYRDEVRYRTVTKCD